MNTHRRSVLLAGAAGATQLVGGRASATAVRGTAITRPQLPYSVEALAPTVSAEAVRVHFGAHHVGHYNRLSSLLGPRAATVSLEEVILQTHGVAALGEIYAAAGQVFNHNCYWSSLRPTPSDPPAALARLLERDFGSVSRMQEQLIAAGGGHFASGWAWLVVEANGRLSVITTRDADTPLTQGLRPLLAIDVWEHAYYLDHRNRRSAHLAALVGNHLNWDFAAANLS